MFFWLAEAKTSAGAPCAMLSARAELAAKLNRTVTPGCAASNCLPSVPNDSVSDAAAKTVTVPDRPPALAVAPPPPVSVPESSPQPARTIAATTTGAASHPRRIRHLPIG